MPGLNSDRFRGRHTNGENEDIHQLRLRQRLNLKEFLVGQAKLEDSPFEISDWSIKEPETGNWKAKARTRIRSVDVVAVICGEETDTATGVSAEVEIAQEEDVPYFLLKGYSQKTCVKPKSAKATDKIYNWTWDNLKVLIAGGR